jgi:hypothetical protein
VMDTGTFHCSQRLAGPSCCAGRMGDTAAHLIDRILPQTFSRSVVAEFNPRSREVR